MAILAAGSATAAIAGALLVLAVTAAVGDSLLDVGNDNLLPPPAPLSAPPNGIDLPPAVFPRTGRYTNGYNLADIIARSPKRPRWRQLRIRWITGNGTIISLREQVQLFTKTKLTITRAGLVDPEKLDDLLARSLFLVSTGGNDFEALGNGGVPMSRAPEFIAGMVADYVKYINYSIGSMYNAYSDMIANPELAGLREVKRACCGGGKFNGEVECSVASSRLCTGRDEHLFWDMAHGTQAAYHWAALAFIYGPARDAEPINLAQLMQEESMVAAAPYSSI